MKKLRRRRPLLNLGQEDRELFDRICATYKSEYDLLDPVLAIARNPHTCLVTLRKIKKGDLFVALFSRHNESGVKDLDACLYDESAFLDFLRKDRLSEICAKARVLRKLGKAR